MIEIFKDLRVDNIRQYTPGAMTLLRNNAQSNLVRTKYWYRKSVHAVESDHILVQVLQHISANYAGNDEDFYYQVNSQSDKIIRALGLNNEVQRSGAMRKNSFFPKNVREFIICIKRRYPSNLDVTDIWMDLEPIKVISHPFTDLTMQTRNGEDFSVGKAGAFLELDIGLLALQYVKWKATVQAYSEVKPIVTQFVYQYPLVNMISSDIDVSFFNRLAAKWENKPMVSQPKRIGLAAVDLNGPADHVIAELTQKLSAANRDFLSLPAQIPLIFLDNLSQKLNIPDVFFNRQNLGLYTLAYFRYLAFLAWAGKETKTQNNTRVAQYLERLYQRLKNGNYFSGIDGVDANRTLQLLESEVLIPLGLHP
ncbi:hypothetical protein TOTORO_00160 [Serratia phage vB_SmaS-Totoro]|nr:hypothetical protein TOTORO_00160 [Serratia phage vB_SmaS-Totoro]